MKYIFRYGVSLSHAHVVDPERVVFELGISSIDFDYSAGQVVRRDELEKILHKNQLHAWELRGVVKPHEYLEKIPGYDFKSGQVADEKELGDNLAYFLDRGAVDIYDPPPKPKADAGLAPAKSQPKKSKKAAPKP